jgi:hypothetical protein
MQEDIATVPFSDASPGSQQLHDTLFAAYGSLVVQPMASRRLFAPREADLVHFGQGYLGDALSGRTLEALYVAFRLEIEP